MGMHDLFNDDYSAPATFEEMMENLKRRNDRLEQSAKECEAAVNEFIKRKI